MLLMIGVCTRNMSSLEYIKKITLLLQVGISSYFTKLMCYWHWPDRVVLLRYTEIGIFESYLTSFLLLSLHN